ncbi:GyrI-like domain-containing protein, partial [Salmonella enterica]|uniref:GyrI-like domain-containing protein n=1 Tax=Salmonella enterica TaxID=28901 RepID=UPI00398C2E46
VNLRLGGGGRARRGVAGNDVGVVNGGVPGGRCAGVRHQGSSDSLPESVWYLVREWLPASGGTPRDFPVFFQYLNFVHEVAEHEPLTDT